MLADLLQQVLAAVPDDRSCHTCDYHRSGTCLASNGEAIPAPVLPVGCKEHQDDGAPF